MLPSQNGCSTPFVQKTEGQASNKQKQLAASKGLAIPHAYICTTESLVRTRHDETSFKLTSGTRFECKRPKSMPDQEAIHEAKSWCPGGKRNINYALYLEADVFGDFHAHSSSLQAPRSSTRSGADTSPPAAVIESAVVLRDDGPFLRLAPAAVLASSSLSPSSSSCSTSSVTVVSGPEKKERRWGETIIRV